MIRILCFLWYPAFLLCIGFGVGGIVAGLKATYGGGADYPSSQFFTFVIGVS